MARKTLQTPLGLLHLTEENGFMASLGWGKATDESDSPTLQRTAGELDAYFNGNLKVFSQPQNLKGTPFQKRVWQALTEIPYGQTVTYGQLAKKLDTSARAVGQACGKNPLPIVVPCHRVLAANGKLGGYSGDGGLKTKEKLLALEKRFN